MRVRVVGGENRRSITVHLGLRVIALSSSEYLCSFVDIFHGFIGNDVFSLDSGLFFIGTSVIKPSYMKFPKRIYKRNQIGYFFSIL
jgi:hypothetical protein